MKVQDCNILFILKKIFYMMHEVSYDKGHWLKPDWRQPVNPDVETGTQSQDRKRVVLTTSSSFVHTDQGKYKHKTTSSMCLSAVGQSYYFLFF